jgi:hypothetical protein
MYRRRLWTDKQVWLRGGRGGGGRAQGSAEAENPGAAGGLTRIQPRGRW